MKNKKKSKLLFGLILSISLIAALVFSFVNPTIHGAIASLLNLKEAGDVPSHTKAIKNNGDGTYTLSLDVKGEAETTIKKANVVVVVDLSNSMKSNAVGTTRTAYTYSEDTYSSDYMYYNASSNGRRVYYRNGAWRTSDTDNGQRYNGTVYHQPNRISEEIKALDALVPSLLANNTEEVNDIIEISVVGYNLNSFPIISNSNNEAAIKNAIFSQRTSEGTNWEEGIKEGLKEANTLKTNEPDEAVYMIFLTDGEPTARTGSSAYTTPPSGATCGYNATHCEVDAYWKHWNAASDDARTAANLNGSPANSLYTIFTYGTNNTYLNYLDNLTHYAYGQDGFTSATIGNQNERNSKFYNATNTTALVQAFTEIAHQINTSGIGAVEVNDGTTTEVHVTSGKVEGGLIEVAQNSYKYYLSFPVTGSGTNLTSGSEYIKTITNVSGNTFKLTDKNNNEYTVERVPAYVVNEKGQETTEVNNNLFKFEWTNGENPFHQVNPPAATFENDAVDWNLKGLGVLKNNVTYTVTFECYPSQATLDLIADLKNGKVTYGEPGPNNIYVGVWDYIDKVGTNDYAVKTNTEATLDYDDTRTDGSESAADYNTVTPVATSAIEQFAISKEWIGGTGDEVITLHVDRDTENGIYDVELKKSNNWQNSVYTSIGIMRVKNDTVELLTQGHDFKFSEDQEVSYRWELTSPTVRPMMINGADPVTLVLVEDEDELAFVSTMTKDHATMTYNNKEKEYYRLTIKSKDDNGNETEEVKYYYIDSQGAELKATNTRKGHLDIRKVVQGEDAPKDQLFEFTITLNNNNASDDTVWFSILDLDKMEYRINETVAEDGETLVTGGTLEYGKVGENGITMATFADGIITYTQNGSTNKVNVGTDYDFDISHFPTGYYEAPSGTSLTIKLRESDSLRFNNVPSGATYTVTESGSIEHFSLVNVESTAKTKDENGNEVINETGTITEDEATGTKTVNGTIADLTGNDEYKAVFTNEYLLTHVEVNKVWDDDNNNDNMRGDGAVFHLYANGVEVRDKKATITYSDGTEVADTDPIIDVDGKVTFKDLPVYDENGRTITYTVKEDAIEGYTTTPESLEGPSGTTFTNSHDNITENKIVTKIWDDDSNHEGFRPDSINITLKANGTAVTVEPTIVKNNDDTWTFTYTGLQVYEDGEEIEYTIEETPVANYEAPVYDQTNLTVTNTRETTKISKTVTKVWEDDSNHEGFRPDSINITLKANGTAVTVEPTITKNNDDTWTYTYENLDKYANGAEIVYTIEETPVANYEEPVYDQENLTVTNSREVETISKVVTKIWDDDSNHEGLRPDVIVIKLLANGEEVEITPTKTVSEDGNIWTYTYEGLDKYKNGNEITYTIVEDDIPNYNENNPDGKPVYDQANLTVTNSREVEKINKVVTKIWDDDSNHEGFRPDSINITLKANGTAVTVEPTITKNNDDTWTYTYENLDKYANGTEIVYTIEETPVANYDEPVYDQANLTVTNSRQVVNISKTVTKIWNDDSNKEGFRPESINLTLKANGTAVTVTPTITKNNDDTWTYTYEGLDKYANGSEIVYTIEETPVANYNNPVYDQANLTVTNSRNVTKEDKVVTKIWEDDSNHEGFRPESIDITLKANGTAVTVEPTISVSEDGNIWTYTYEDLDVFANGEEIEYTIEETPVENYNDPVYDQANLTVTNSRETTKINKTVTKIWDDDSNHEGFRPESINITLKANGTAVTVEPTITKNNDDTWTYTYENLDKFANGAEIEYTIEETPVENYEEPVYDQENLTVTNSRETTKISKTVTKVWDDDSNHEGFRPDSIELTLKANGTAVTVTPTITKNNDDTWTYTYENLDKFANGAEIVYTIEEEQVANYDEPVYNQSTLTVTNSRETTKISKTVTKIWDDDSNHEGFRPEVIVIKLLANGEEVKVEPTKSVSEDGNSWIYTYTGLDKYKDGAEITYTIEETPIENYNDPVYDQANLTVTNSRETTKISKTVTKIWNDDSNHEGFRPDSIELTLKANGTAVTVEPTITKNNDDTWTYTYENLDKFANGAEIVYTIEETPVENYDEPVYDQTNLTVTNSRETTKISKTVTKIWEDDSNHEGFRPDSINITLKANGTAVSVEPRITKNENDTWTYVYTNLDKFANGEEIVYTIEETPVENYNDPVYDQENLTVTNTRETTKISKTVTKIWEDDSNHEGFRPDVIVIKLLANGEEVKVEPTKSVSEDGNSWIYTYEGLDKYKDGAEIVYTIEETPVTNYDEPVYDQENLTVTNRRETTKISKTVTKIWNDDSNHEGFRPDSIELTLKANGTAVTVEPTITKNNDDTWTYTYENLDKFANGAEIVYTIEETPVENYDEPVYDQTNLTVTNSRETTKISKTVTKIWEDDSNHEGFRPDSIELTLKANGTAVTVEPRIVKNNDDTWTYVYTNLDKFANGEEIVYTIEETPVENYDEPVYDQTNLTVTNSRETTKISKTVTKIWNDDSNHEGFRPEVIVIKLLANGEEVEITPTKSVSEDGNSWIYTYEGLDKYKDGAEIVYTIEETPVTNYDEPVYDQENLTVTNSRETIKISKEVTKVWEDESNIEGFRPDSIELTLKANGTAVDVQPTITKDGNKWKYTYANLDKFANGAEIEYTIEETKVENYEEPVYNQDTLTVTNPRVVERIRIPVTKYWDDNNDQDGLRPEKLTVTLVGTIKDEDGKDKKVYENSIELKQSTEEGADPNTWTGSFDNLLKNSEGKEIVYTLSEEEVTGYKGVVDGSNITNTHKPATLDFEGNKVWKDNNDQDGIRPEYITIVLTGTTEEDGKVVEEKTTIRGESEAWAYSFKGVPKLINKGHVITYELTEEYPEGYENADKYEFSREQTDEGGINLINTHDPKKIRVHGLKTWEDEEDQDGIRPDSITVTLYADGEVVKDEEGNDVTTTATKDSKWEYEFTNLPQYRDKGTAISYSVVETGVDGYSVAYSITVDETTGDTIGDITNSHTPAKVIVTGTKTWDDADNQDGIRPDSITVKLIADGEVVTDEEGNEVTATADEASKWSFTFDNLPKYKDHGTEIDYSVEEVEVSGYTVTIDKEDREETEEPTETGETGETEETEGTGETGEPEETEGTGETGEPEETEEPEEPVEEPTEDKGTITYTVKNKHIPDVVTYTVTKVWDDEDNNDGIRPKSITVNLLADGEKVDSKTLSDSEGWTCKFENLPKNKAGKEIVYTIEEEVVEGYEAKITVNDDNKTIVTILNKHVTEKITINGKKYWVDDEKHLDRRPETIRVNIYADGVLIDTITVKATDNWEYELKDLYKFKKGQKITYTIDEEEVDGYITTYQNYDIINTFVDGEGDIIPPNTSVNVETVRSTAELNNIFVLLITSLVVAIKGKMFE